MNETQKKIMIAVAIGLVITFLFPPSAQFIQGGARNMEYSFIANLSNGRTVHILMLLAEWLGIVVIGGIAYFIAKDTQRECAPQSQSNYSKESTMARLGAPNAMSKYKRWLIRGIGFLFVLLIYSLWKEIDKEAGTSSVLLRGAFVGISLLWITKISNTTKADKEKKNQTRSKSSNQPTANEPYLEEKYYSIALKEIESNNLSTGLWGKALAYSDGNLDKAKSYYLKERANQLIQMHQEKLNRTTKDPATNKIDKKPVSALRIFSVILCSGMIVSIIAALAPSPNSTPNIGQRANDLYSQGLYSEAFPFALQLAEQNNSDWQNTLGTLYESGKGIAQDYSQAVYWYRKAAEQGNAFGQNNLGALYESGKGIAQDYSQAMQWYRKAAEQGNALGQSNLGYMYDNGRGVTQDYSQAVYWYRKSAEQGNAFGQSNLGYMYAFGNGIAQDYSQAVQWYRKAAEQGNAIGQSNLGELYESGKGVTQDYSQAAYWYRKSVEEGNADAAKMLQTVMQKQGLK